MYIPASFRESDRERLFDLIEQYSFAILVSESEGEPFATHLPLLLDRTAGPHGSLIGHVAQANPQWQMADGKTVLAIFSGPHAYVSPSWYEADNVVPTWNYVAVHACGVLRAIDDRDEVLNIVSRYVEVFEGSRPQPWKFDAGSEFSTKLAAAIVGFRIEISRLEGKWKLSQNHPEERRRRVVRALETLADDDAKAIASLMRQRFG